MIARFREAVFGVIWRESKADIHVKMFDAISDSEEAVAHLSGIVDGRRGEEPGSF
jgi:hypothetical protein